MSRRPYHHGDLRAALVAAARAAVESGGPEAVSLRDLAQTLGVSTAAPYRHFADRRALLAAVATEGFAELEAAYAGANAAAADPAGRMRGLSQAYLSLALDHPGLFRLMFASDIIGADSPITLLQAAGKAWDTLHAAVAAVDPTADRATIVRRTITGWSTLHGFITLSQGGRLMGFMTEPLTQADLIAAILDKSVVDMGPAG